LKFPTLPELSVVFVKATREVPPYNPFFILVLLGDFPAAGPFPCGLISPDSLPQERLNIMMMKDVIVDYTNSLARS
jgi:hypothetical protein